MAFLKSIARIVIIPSALGSSENHRQLRFGLRARAYFEALTLILAAGSTKGSAAFKFGVLGGNSCPTGYTFISSIAECQKATALLVPGQWSGHAAANWSTNNPKGDNACIVCATHAKTFKILACVNCIKRKSRQCRTLQLARILAMARHRLLLRRRQQQREECLPQHGQCWWF